MVDTLPEATPIPKPEEVAAMILISSEGLRGEDDFKCQRLRKARLMAGMAGGHQVEKS